MFIKEKCLGNETERARQGTERRELKTGKETDRTGRNDFQTRERGTGNDIRLGVLLRYQARWRVATRFPRQCPHNRSTGPSTGVCKFCADGRSWSRGSRRSRTPARHQLRLAGAVVGFSWGWSWARLARAVRRGKPDELPA